jgi:hypothetical protein
VRPKVEIPDRSKTHLRVLRHHREKRGLAFYEILLVCRRPAEISNPHPVMRLRAGCGNFRRKALLLAID